MNITLEFELFDLTAEPTSPEPTAAGFGGPYAANTWVTNVYVERKELGVEQKSCEVWMQPVATTQPTTDQTFKDGVPYFHTPFIFCIQENTVYTA